MKIVVAHNFYQQPGGEDRVFADEVEVLRSRGHEVATFEAHNDAIRDRSRLGLLGDTMWNRRLAAQLHSLVERHRADVVHFHNTFPLISPAAYYAARRAGAAVVQTLHNFRLLCPAANLFREGRVCESCVGTRTAWPAIVHACYRESRLATAASAVMLTMHRALGTWRSTVDRYIALTEFARRKFITGGLPEEKIAVKPNFIVEDLGAAQGHGNFALFIGRLASYKGIDALLEAWSTSLQRIPLKVVGDGPLHEKVRRAAASQPNIEWLGSLPHTDVQELLGRATLLVLPSTCYEGFPKTIVEAFARGTPVVASRLGAMAEAVEDARTGKLFAPGSAAGLTAAVEAVWSMNSTAAQRMREACRTEFTSKYTASLNHDQLMAIYREALVQRHGATSATQLLHCEVS